jgi:hypothetical protein
MSMHKTLESVLSTYEATFGEVQDDFPPPVQPGPRRRMRIAGYVLPIGSEGALVQAAVHDAERSNTELLADGRSMCLIEFSGGVATASMLSGSEKFI